MADNNKTLRDYLEARRDNFALKTIMEAWDKKAPGFLDAPLTRTEMLSDGDYLLRDVFVPNDDLEANLTEWASKVLDHPDMVEFFTSDEKFFVRMLGSMWAERSGDVVMVDFAFSLHKMGLNFKQGYGLRQPGEDVPVFVSERELAKV